jgi:thiol-disulfide isomerase/thioredoxin
VGIVAAGLVTVIVVLAAATGLGLWWRWRDGRLRPVAAEPAPLDDLGFRPGTPVTLVQFSSAFCVPCRVTRRICQEVAGRFEGVAHLEVDAESHLDAVRRLEIWRTPTVLIVDSTGRIVRRATGTPGKAQVIAAIAALLPAGAAR